MHLPIFYSSPSCGRNEEEEKVKHWNHACRFSSLDFSAGPLTIYAFGIRSVSNSWHHAWTKWSNKTLSTIRELMPQCRNSSLVFNVRSTESTDISHSLYFSLVACTVYTHATVVYVQEVRERKCDFTHRRRKFVFLDPRDEEHESKRSSKVDLTPIARLFLGKSLASMNIENNDRFLFLSSNIRTCITTTGNVIFSLLMDSNSPVSGWIIYTAVN